MVKTIFKLLACGVLLAGCAEHRSVTNESLDYCVKQVERTLEQLPADDYNVVPRNIAPGESVWNTRRVCKEEWTEGFWSGILWYAYEHTGSDVLLEKAQRYTEQLKFLSEIPAYDHDLGFIVFTSYGNGYRLTGDERYRDVIINTSERLIELFNPKVGTILSWPREVAAFNGHNTIMDNLINLEMLFWTAEQTGDKRFSDIARTHADTTMRYNFREDGTSYHVAVYSEQDGSFIRGCTHQGYADDSMWARGQAWGIYGYTMCYRFTKDERYRDFAERIANVYIDALPEDGIPYWDFNDPRIPAAPRDASAAAVVASALLELSTYCEGESGEYYRKQAERMIESLGSDAYRSGEVAPSFVLHSTGHHPAGSEIDYSIIYADYYYIEALHRLARLERGVPVV